MRMVWPGLMEVFLGGGASLEGLLIIIKKFVP